MSIGRPTEYSDETLNKATSYLESLPADEVLHSIEGLADFIGVARSTVYEWAKQPSKVAFSDIVERILNKQGKTLINSGVSGKFNATIAKVMMTKHGYREGIESSGPDGTPLNENVADAIKSIYGSGGPA